MRHDSRGLEETTQNHAVSSAGVAGVQLLRAAFLPASYGRAAADRRSGGAGRQGGGMAGGGGLQRSCEHVDRHRRRR